MGWARSTHGGSEKCSRNFIENISKGREYMGVTGVDGRIPLKWIIKKYGVRMWTGFMVQWWTLVNKIINLRVS
jgi:hypothetical protein